MTIAAVALWALVLVVSYLLARRLGRLRTWPARLGAGAVAAAGLTWCQPWPLALMLMSARPAVGLAMLEHGFVAVPVLLRPFMVVGSAAIVTGLALRSPRAA